LKQAHKDRKFTVIVAESAPSSVHHLDTQISS
jgi:translation initiation factor 2B subunit (eIF-2B alpha/beta/delta family)